MRSRSWLLLLFVLYCIETGTLLVLWPWSGSWEQVWSLVDWPGARELLLSHPVRGLVTAFGVLHLVWGAHDLDLLLHRWRARIAERRAE